MSSKSYDGPRETIPWRLCLLYNKTIHIGFNLWTIFSLRGTVGDPNLCLRIRDFDIRHGAIDSSWDILV